MRVIVNGLFLVSVLTTSFANLGQLPATILRPVGALKLLPWQLYDRLLTPEGMIVLKCLMGVSLLLSTLGLFTPYSTKTSAALVLFYEGLLRSLGHFSHDEMPAVYALVVLAFVPCGDAFSVDSRRSIWGSGKKGFRYGYPILLIELLLAWSYFTSAIIKLRVSGLGYFSKDSLPALAISHSLDNMHLTSFRLAFQLPHYREYTPFLVAATVTWELLFPFAIFWRRARWWILGAGVLFHVATLFIMNIFFPYHLALYLVFVNWGRVFKHEEGE